MKCHKIALVSALALMAAFAAPVQASVISIVSNPDTLIDSTHSYTYTFDLATQGFILGTTHYTSGSLVVRLTDTNQNESGSIVYDSQTLPTSSIANNTYNDPTLGTTYTITLNTQALADLNVDGKLAMTINAIDPTQGQPSVFYFADATLTASEAVGRVPEPVSLSLLGAGCAGMLASRRRKSKV